MDVETGNVKAVVLMTFRRPIIQATMWR